MTCHQYEDDIGDYVDGTLPAGRATALDAHLERCAPCRAMVADFRVLRSAAASLERKSPPPHVWARVAAALDETERPRSGWRGWFPTPAAWRPAAAAAVLVALIAGGTWVAWREAGGSRPPARTAAPEPQTAAATAALQLPDQVITQQIAHLEGIVTADEDVLPDETKAVYQVTGGVIDDAIGESRAVLQTQPSNELAQESLFEALRSKLALLQDMVALINEMRKGNQEGAARIVSELEQ